jgi:hypothetical protein
LGRHPDDIQNSIDNIAYTVLRLEHEKYVVGFEVGYTTQDMLQHVIDKCRDRMLELNAERELGEGI